MNGGTAVFRLEGITVDLGGRTVLRIPGLSLEGGRRTCLVGPNGAGKTVTLSLLAGLLPPASGTLAFRGEAVEGDQGRRHLRKRVTFVNQAPYLFRGTVLDNVAFGLKVRKIPRHRRRPFAEEALARVGLSGFENRDARQLSGGEVQRVAIARAVACRPDVYLLDEPTASIDSHSVGLIEKIVGALTEEGDATVIFTSHDPAQARRLGERTLFMNEGRIFEGTSRCILRGRIEKRGGETVFDTGRIRLAVPGGRPGEKRLLAIDERAVRLQSGRKSGGGDSLLSGRVLSLTSENGLVRVEVSVEGEKLALVTTAESVRREGIEPGKELILGLPPEAVQLC